MDAEVTAQEATQEMAIGLADVQDTGMALPAAGDLRLTYRTGWSPAYIHYKLDDGEWTEAPGELMRESAEGSEVSCVVLGRTLEFVLTDGLGNWDKPSAVQNYFINEPGDYCLARGKISRVEPDS